MAGKFKMPSIKDVEQEENKDVVVKEKFKVGAGLLSDISKGAVVMDVVNIPRDQIQKNPNNHYSISGIESLAESIKQYGLLQPVHVMETETGYRLLGGERRLTAIDKLIADAGVPGIPTRTAGIEPPNTPPQYRALKRRSAAPGSIT